MIWTDKEDYSPGETVTISGSGFNANAEITITIVQPNGTEDTITANSDDNGSFNAYYVIDNDDPVGLYTVTATDGTNTASTTFTDANMSCTPNLVTLGNSVTCTATGIGNKDRPAHFEWYDASNNLQRNSGSGSCNAGNCSDTFTPNSTGTWTVKLVKDSDNSVRATATFLVTSPGPITVTDETPPVIQPIISGTLGNNDWYVSDVTVSWNVSDPESGIASSSGCDTVTIDYDTTGETLTCSATNGAGLSNSVSVTIKRDATPPTVNATPDRPADNNGWYNHPLTITFSGDDATSGIASCDSPVTYNGPDGTSITVTGSCTDNAGNSATGSFTFDYDATPPTVNILGISNGDEFDFGDSLPSVTCNATDNLSGIESCTIDPETLPTSVGTHTITATAKDNAGNEASTSIQYTIVAWTIKGFYQPVDNPPIVNVVKNGSTIPLKFEVFKTISGEEITDTSKIVQPLKAQKINCGNLNGSSTDEIELTATGGTSLRYDITEGQFIYNWKTPTQKDTCWKVTVYTIDDSSIYAYFRLK
jgi:hypothetical protein